MSDLMFDVIDEDTIVDVVVTDAVIDAGITETVVAVVTVEGPPGQQGPPGDGSPVVGEQLTGIDGVRTTFTTDNPFRTSTTAIYLNGLREQFYTETSSNTVTLEDPPLPGDTLHIDYVIEG